MACGVEALHLGNGRAPRGSCGGAGRKQIPRLAYARFGMSKDSVHALLAGASWGNNQTVGELFLGVGFFLGVDEIESAFGGGRGLG